MTWATASEKQAKPADPMEKLASLIARAQAVSFKMKGGGWCTMKLNEEKRAAVAARLRGDKADRGICD